MASKEEFTVDVVMGEPSSEINSFSTKDQLKAECAAEDIEEESKLTIEELEFVKTEIKSNEESKCFPIKQEVGEPSSAGNSQIPIKAEVNKHECTDEDIEERRNEDDESDFSLDDDDIPLFEDFSMDINLRRIAGSIEKLCSNVGDSDAADPKFCVEDVLLPTDIHITVEGIGKLEFPLTNACIEKLKGISSKAKFGVGEKTVLDENFRDTHVIEPNKLEVNIEEPSLLRILKNTQEAFKLPSEATLNAQLHNLLIYGPGQFFDLHRDSEKIPNMIATLVVVLPSPHIGGDLVVEHGDKKHELSTENFNETNAKCACFYSDCWHKVNKIKDGHRIVLTFNVGLRAESLISLKPVDKYLKRAVQEYFESEDELIFLLNHSYSQHSLRWNLLKGEDQLAASHLFAVAKRLNLVLHLALIEIHYHYACDEDYGYPSRRSVPSAGDLIDDEYELHYWIDEKNKEVCCTKRSVGLSQICFTTETTDLSFNPTKTDYSGATGNAGATIDHWYKRAAIVIWRKADLEKFQFLIVSENAFEHLHSLVKTPGNENEIYRLLNVAGQNIYRYIDDGNFGKFVDIVLYLKDITKTNEIISKFSGSVLTIKNILHLVSLQNQHGAEFCLKMLQVWLKKGSISYLYRFIIEFLKAGADNALVHFIVESKITSLIKNSPSYSSTASKEEYFDHFKTLDHLGKTDLLRSYVEYITKGNKNSKFVLYETLLELQKTELENLENLELLKLLLIQSIEREIGKGGWTWYKSHIWCTCHRCETVNTFLKSGQQILRIGGNNRKHFSYRIHTQPVEMTIEGRGQTAVTTFEKKPHVHEEGQDDINKLNTLLKRLVTVGTSTKREALDSLNTNDVVKRTKT